MRKIVEACKTDYLLLFGDYRTGFSDLAAGSALETGKLYMLMDDGHPAGYLCVEDGNAYFNILYGFTVPKKRNTGVFTALMQHAAEEAAKPVKFNLTETNSCFSQVDHIRKKIGFQMDSSCVIYSGQREDFVNWEHYMEKSGNTLCRLLKEQGYSCQSFATADKELLDSLYQSGYNNFHNMLDVKPFFDDPNHCMDKTMSFLEQKDGIVTAYTLVRRPDKKNVVFEHISCHQDHIGSGCILLPFAQSMKMFQKYGCQRGVYAMYEENSHANAFRKKLLKMVTSSCRRSYNFIYAK